MYKAKLIPLVGRGTFLVSIWYQFPVCQHTTAVTAHTSILSGQALRYMVQMLAYLDQHEGGRGGGKEIVRGVRNYSVQE